jgi:hypothetical protein
LLGRKKKEAEQLGYAALRLRRARSDSKAAILIKLLASTVAPAHNSKRAPFGETTLHAPTAEQHGAAPLDAPLGRPHDKLPYKAFE